MFQDGNVFGTEDRLPHQIQEQLNRAREAIDERKFRKAVSILSEVTKLAPRCEEAYRMLTRTYLMLHEREQQQAAATKLIDLNPELAEGYALRANAATWLRQWEQAVTDATQAIELDITCELAYSARASALIHLGRFAEGQADHSKLSLLRDGPAKVAEFDHKILLAKYLEAGRAHFSAARFLEAIQAFSAILYYEPDNLESLQLRAAAYHRIGRFQNASTDLMKACEALSERARSARGFVVIADVVGKGEKLIAAFPDTDDGLWDASWLASDVIDDKLIADEYLPSDCESRFVRVLHFNGASFDMVDFARRETTEVD